MGKTASEGSGSSPSDDAAVQAPFVPALRICSLMVGCMGVGISYVVNAFNVFALDLKQEFMLSQTELEILLSLMFLGLCASLPGGMLLDRFGSRWTTFFALIMSSTGYLMVWSTTLNPVFYRKNFPILAVFFTIAGIGGGLTYMAATASNIRNFGPHLRGTVVGVLHASLSAGPAFIMLAYNTFFAPLAHNDGDLGGFFIFLVVAFACINLLGIIFYDHYPPDEATLPLLSGGNDNPSYLATESHDLTATTSLPPPVEEVETKERTDFLTTDFHLLFWPFVILTALQMMFVQNLTTILESVGAAEYNTVFPYLTPIFGTIAKPLIGLSSDAVVQWVPRTVFIIVGCVMDMVLWAMCIFMVSSIPVILIATTGCDIAAYVVYSLGPPMMIERFGLANFSRNWGLVMAGFSIITGSMLGLFGAVYDMNAAIGDSMCLGTICFVDTFATCTVISAVSLVCAVAYFTKYRKIAAPSHK